MTDLKVIEDIFFNVDLAIKEYCQNSSPAAIQHRVTRLLEQEEENIVKKLLGFETRWHNTKWEIDHCNGRMSTISEHLENAQKAAVDKRLAKVPLPDISIGLEKKIATEFNRKFKATLSSKIDDLVVQQVNDLAESMVEEIVTKIGTNKKLEMISLLQQGMNNEQT